MFSFAGTTVGSQTALCRLVTAATSPAAPVVYNPLLLLLLGEQREVRTVIQIVQVITAVRTVYSNLFRPL